MKDRDRHIATRLRVVRKVDLTHAAGPEGGEDLVRADTSDTLWIAWSARQRRRD